MPQNGPAPEATFRSLLEFSPDAMIAVDGSGRIVLVNAQAERLFGYTRQEFMGQTMEMLVPEKYRGTHAAHRRDYGRQPRARPMGAGIDLLALRRDGTEFPVEISLSPLETPEGTLFMAAVRDVTEQRLAREFLKNAQSELEAKIAERTEELRAANEALRREISERRRLEDEILTISEEERQRIGQDLHDDLGQSLLGIALMAKILEEGSENRSRGGTNPASEIARRANEAIQKARDLARGLFPVAVQNGGLAVALQELAENIETHSGVSCVVDADDGFESEELREPQVPLQLFRIAQEAINNAIRHGKPGQVRLRLRRIPGGTELSIEDDGTGIPANADAGRGMGLKVMHYRATRIGGILTVSRRPEGGTAIVCRILRPGSVNS